MPLSRFSQVSRYRNATLVVGKSHERFAEVALGSAPDNGLGSLIAVTPTSSHIVARSSASSNSLLLLPSNAARKYGKQPPTVHGVCSGGAIGDFDLARFQDDDQHVILAAGSTNGSLSVSQLALPTLSGEDVALPLQNRLAEKTSTAADQTSITNVQFNPVCPSLVLTSSSSSASVNLWDTHSGTAFDVIDSKGHVWDAKWDVQGARIASSGKDGVVRLWDARNHQTNISEIHAHASKVKPTKMTFITAQTSHLLLTTGFSQMRQREIAVWDVRNASTALKRISLDVASSGLEPICDHDRGLVYMLAKGDASVRWIDVGSQDQGATFAEGVHQLDVAAAGGAIAPPSTCDTSVGEIAKLYVATATSSNIGGASGSDVIVPASVRVPRRNYIDFHADLYPETAFRGSNAGIDIDAWRAGKAANLEVRSLNPAVKSGAGKPAQQSLASGPVKSLVSTEPAAISAMQPEASGDGQATEQAAVQQDTRGQKTEVSIVQTPPLTKQELRAASNGASEAPVHGNQPLMKRPHAASAKPTVPVHWSRRPMAGSTPLIAAYQNLGALDVSRGPDARMLAVSRKFLFVPLAGPGGRLGVHPVSSHGRLPVHMPYFSHGTPIVDFVVDPFSDEQVYTLSGDGTLRLWSVPELKTGEEGLYLSQDDLSNSNAQISGLHLPSSAKYTEMLPHPYVQGLVAVIPSDADGRLLLIDVASSKILLSLQVPGDGLHSGAWSFDGSVLAVGAKNRRIYVLDVRKSSTSTSDEVRILAESEAHDSPRSFRVLWIDGMHLLSVGHTTGSLRQLKLYRLGGESGLEILTKHNMDASPSVLFPHWDADTNILWLWSKGERIVSSFEVQPDTQAVLRAVGEGADHAAKNVAQRQQQETFTVLPAFQHGQPQLGMAFLPKDVLDVRNVVIAAAVRLSRSDMQRVAWSVPRSRPEFFQDDVYPPTLLVRQPLLSVHDWLNGKDVLAPPRTSLQPADMTALSQAPPPAHKSSSLSKGPTKRQLTDKEQEDAMFRDIFEKAKGNDREKDPNHNEDQAARAPSDDDWDDD